MPSTYSEALRLELQATGENRSTWGIRLNTVINLIEDAVTGILSITMSDANKTLTELDGNSDESRHASLVFTGTLTADRTIIIPTTGKMYYIKNSTTGGFSLVISNGTNTVTIPNGDMCFVHSDGTTILKSLDVTGRYFSAYGLTLVDDADAATARTTLGAQASNATLTSLSGLSLAAGDVLYATAADTLARLPKGTAAQVLVMNAGATAPEWRTDEAANSVAATRSALKAVDTTKTSNVTLTEPGREGNFIWRSGDYAARVTADTAEGLYLASDTIATTVGAWVRQSSWIFTGLDAGWFGWDAANSGADNSTAMAAAMSAAAICGQKKINIGAGDYKIGSTIALTAGVNLVASGNSAESGSSGYASTIIRKDFDGGFAVTLGDSTVIDGFDIIPTPGKTGGGVSFSGSRARADHISCFDLTGTAFDLSDASKNINLWRMNDCHATDCSGVGLNIAQFRPETAWAVSTTYTIGQERYDSSNGLNYRCEVGHTSPGSGTFAAARTANPTYWALSSFPFGAPDTNAGLVTGLSVLRCDTGVVLQNTSDNQFFGLVIQNCTTRGVELQYDSRGNEIHAYLEANGTGTSSSVDIYIGPTLAPSANRIHCGALVQPTILDQSTAGSNIISYAVNDGTTRRYVQSVSSVHHATNPRVELLATTSYFSVAELSGSNPSGSAGKLDIRVKQNGGALRDVLTAYENGDLSARFGYLFVNKTSADATTAGHSLYPEGRHDFTRTSSGVVAAFYTSGVSQGLISVSGGTTTYGTTSDYRRKSNLGAVDGSLIHKLKPVSFDMDGIRQCGFLAHEFAQVFPNSVIGAKDAVGANGEPVYQALQAGSAEVIAALVAEIQHLASRVAALEGIAK